MFAVVTESAKHPHGRRITVTTVGCACLIEVGRKVSRRTLNRNLKKFGGDVILGTGLDLRGIIPFDTKSFKERLLFNQFVRYVLASEGRGLFIGVCDTNGRLLLSEELTELVVHAESTVICTEEDANEHCLRWLIDTGICPDVTSAQSNLLDCDLIFAPDGLSGARGTVFGRGGRGLDRGSLPVPEIYHPLLRAGADPAEVLCMLEREAEVQHI